MTVVYILLALVPFLVGAGIYRLCRYDDIGLFVLGLVLLVGCVIATVIIQNHERDILRDKAEHVCTPYVATIVSLDSDTVSFACEGGRKAHLLQQIKN